MTGLFALQGKWGRGTMNGMSNSYRKTPILPIASHKIVAAVAIAVRWIVRRI